MYGNQGLLQDLHKIVMQVSYKVHYDIKTKMRTLNGSMLMFVAGQTQTCQTATFSLFYYPFGEIAYRKRRPVTSFRTILTIKPLASEETQE